MGNYFLKPVFKELLDRNFNATSFDDRLEMQKIVYLLQNLGISIGNYSFMWYKHGPYSQTLQNDILNINNTPDKNIIFSDDAKIAFTDLKNAIFLNDESVSNYSLKDWLECLGSVCYLKDNLIPLNTSDDDLLKELEHVKPHLNSQIGNRNAIEVINKLFYKR